MSLIARVALVLEAGSARVCLAASVYARSVAALCGASALIAASTGEEGGTRRWMRRRGR